MLLHTASVALVVMASLVLRTGARILESRLNVQQNPGEASSPGGEFTPSASQPPITRQVFQCLLPLVFQLRIF